MCGRFTHAAPDTVLAELDLVGSLEAVDFSPSYNIAPGQDVICVVNRSEDPVRRLRWGLVPHWANDPRVGYRMINARAEGLGSKPAFRDSYAQRRCLVVADGFYEWQHRGGKKIPFYFTRPGGFGFAGVWARWRARDAQAGDSPAPKKDVLSSVAIVTGPANELVAAIHDRMPVVVAPEDYRRWLEPDRCPPDALADILAKPDYRRVESYQVSQRVNSAKNDGPDLIEPAPVQQELF